MLLIVGEYLQKIDGDKSSIGGLGYDVSLEIAKHGSSVSFESLISDDDEGISILDKLITAGVLFDPLLCNCSFPTANYNEKENRLSFNKSCSAMLTKAQLKDSISNNDDVKVIHFGSFSFYSPVTGKSVLDTFFELRVKPIFYFNPSISKTEISNIIKFKEKSILALSICTIAQIDDIFLDELYSGIDNKINTLMESFPQLNVIYIEDNQISYFSSFDNTDRINLSKTFSLKISNDSCELTKAIIAASFLSFIHENDVFGDELSDPIYQPNLQIIEKALDFVVKNLN